MTSHPPQEPVPPPATNAPDARPAGKDPRGAYAQGRQDRGPGQGPPPPPPGYGPQPAPGYRPQPPPGYRPQPPPGYRPQPPPGYRPQPPSYPQQPGAHPWQPPPSGDVRTMPPGAPRPGPDPARPPIGAASQGPPLQDLRRAPQTQPRPTPPGRQPWPPGSGSGSQPPVGQQPPFPPGPPPVGPSGPAAEAPADTRAADRTLAVGGGACVAVSLASVILRLAHVLPSGFATVIVVLVVAVGLRIFVRYAAKSASSAHRTRVTKTVAMVGLGISVLTVVTSLPVLLRGGGSNDFVSNVFAHLWTIAILIAVVGSARTLNWQTLIGMGLTGFLAVSGLAFAILRPMVKALGSNSVLASVVLAPLLEEVLKALPAFLILIFAARRRQARPSALEMALLGAVIGSGYALYEDTQYHRGGFHFAAMPIIGIVNPTANADSSIRVTYFGAGHMVYTMLIVFGLGIGLMYRRHYWWAKYAIPVCFAVSFCEHATQNYATLIAIHQGNVGIFDLLRVVTLWGWLSSLLLIAGLVVVGRDERRATSNGLSLKDSVLTSFWLRPPSAHHAAAALARLQHSAPAPIRQGASR